MKKVFKILALLIVLLLTAAIILPFVFKDKILQIAKEETNKNVNAKINFSDNISLSLFKSFPNFSVGINDLSIVGINEFEGDTLLYINEATATLDLMSVLKGEQIMVRSIVMNAARIHAIILKNGKANWDITKPTDSNQTDKVTEPSKFSVKLKKFESKNSYISYVDNVGNMSSEIDGLNYVLNGDFNQDLFTMKNTFDVERFTFTMAGISYLNKVKGNGFCDVEANMNDMKFAFKNNEININELQFSAEGNFEMKNDDIIIDIKYAAKKNDFKDFLSLIPAIYSSDFKDLESKGKMSFNGTAKGIYNETSMPGFTLKLLVENGWFKYPALPTPVENVAIILNITNPDGNLNNTKIDLSKLHFELQGDAFDAKLLAINPIEDPYIEAYLKGNLNFENIVKIAPMPEGTKLSGLINSDFEAKGKIADIENKKYANFYAGGTIKAENIVYSSKELPLGLNIKNAMLSFSPELVKLTDFEAKIGNSDMQLNGGLGNFFPYFFGKGNLIGNLDIKSNTIDANQFLSKGEKNTNTVKDSTSLSVVEIPSNIDFTLTGNVGKLLYTNMEIDNFNGTVNVSNQKLSFNKVALNTLGANISMDGFYETSNAKHPTVNFTFGIKNLDIQKAFKTFNTVKKIAPIAEKMKGSFSTNVFKFTTELDSKMMPVYDKLYANGDLILSNAEVSNVEALNKLADVLKRNDLRKLELNDVTIKYEVSEGRIFTKPFLVKAAGQNITLSGSTGLDQTIDYTGTASVSKKDLGAANSAVNDALKQLNQKAATNIKMNEMINVGIKIGGTFTKPVVSTNLADIAKSEAENLKNQLADEVNKKKKELEAQAKAEIEKLKKEAENKATAEIDRIKKEVETKANAEKNRLKKLAEEEAKKRLKGLFGK